MYAVILTALLLDKPAPPGKPPPAPVPRQPVNRPQPRDHRPYIPREGTRPDPRYHTQHGQRFKHGYYYRGHQHRHWDHHYWDRRYGAWLYHCPSTRVYYYFCQPHHCYYPVSYVPPGCRYDYDFDPDPRPPKKPPPAPPPADDDR